MHRRQPAGVGRSDAHRLLGAAETGRVVHAQRTAGKHAPAHRAIHEAYLQLAQCELPGFESRAHFFGIAARIMRQLLIGNARRYHAQKRGGGSRAEMQDDIPLPAQQAEELLAVDEALGRLARQDERKAKVIELKNFGGLSREEIAETLGLSVATVKHDLALGEDWLRRALSSKPAGRAIWPS